MSVESVKIFWEIIWCNTRNLTYYLKALYFYIKSSWAKLADPNNSLRIYEATSAVTLLTFVSYRYIDIHIMTEDESHGPHILSYKKCTNKLGRGFIYYIAQMARQDMTKSSRDLK